MIARDYDSNKKELFDILTGNVKELNDPANYSNRNNNYPSAYKLNNSDNSNLQHSINSYQLYIPINHLIYMEIIKHISALQQCLFPHF